MIGFFKNNKGSGLIGILVVVFIMAALVYGGVFFSKNTDDDENINSPIDAINTLNKAKGDIADINKATEERQDFKDVIPKMSEEDYEMMIKHFDGIHEDANNNEFDEYIITVSNIKAGDNIVSPVVIEGEAVAFENTIIVELRNQEHETMVKEFVTTKAPDVGKSGPFKITLSFDFSSTKEGYLAVYEESAKDGQKGILAKS